MRTNYACLGLSVFLIALTSNAQNQSEFIESSSPLPGGGRVVSRSTTGGLQTVAVSGANSDNELRLNSNASPQLPSQTTGRESVFRQSAAVPTSSSAATYPYPAANRLPAGTGSARTALFHQPVRATATCRNCAVPYQIPTLGLTGSVQAARQTFTPSNCCAPQVAAPPASLTVPAAQAPVLQLQAPANQVPSLAIQDPGQAATFAGQGFQTQINPNIGVPQFGTQRNSFLSPFVTGSGAYQPIVRLANMPPGTYLGQGIIGQPTAYVDGQPIRNLLRYVFP